MSIGCLLLCFFPQMIIGLLGIFLAPGYFLLQALGYDMEVSIYGGWATSPVMAVLLWWGWRKIGKGPKDRLSRFASSVVRNAKDFFSDID